MVVDYSTKKCPECGGEMIKVNEKMTYDGPIEDWKCPKCGYQNF